MTNTTFIIPVKYDHPDREQNLCAVMDYLRKNFDYPIIIGEVQTKQFNYFTKAEYIHFDLPNFHRTKALNELTKAAKTPYVFNYDADVIIPVGQLKTAVKWLQEGADIVYPFDGTHACVERYDAQDFFTSLDTKDFKLGSRYRNWHNPTKSVGGAIGYNVESFWKAGGENENFISYGPEDSERFYRYTTLGLDVRRVPGPLYHIEHHKSLDSCNKHPLFQANENEWQRVKKMNKEQLQTEINNWPWIK